MHHASAALLYKTWQCQLAVSSDAHALAAVARAMAVLDEASVADISASNKTHQAYAGNKVAATYALMDATAALMESQVVLRFKQDAKATARMAEAEAKVEAKVREHPTRNS